MMSSWCILKRILLRSPMRRAAAILLLLLAAQAGAEVGTTWTMAVAQPPWGGNEVKNALVHNNRIHVVTESSLWRSDNGTSWTLAADLPDRMSSTMDFVSFQGRLWAIPINDNTAVPGTKKPVFSADGKVWTPVSAADAPWAQGYRNTTLVYHEKIWVFYRDGLKAYCSGDGKNWLLANTPPGVSRSGASLVVFDDKMWMLGGYREDGLFANDGWCSTDGQTWTQAYPSANLYPRNQSGTVVFDGRLWLIGGYHADTNVIDPYNVYSWEYYFNDVHSTDDGIRWDKIPGNAPECELGTESQGSSYPSGRYYPYYPVSFQNKIWLFCGHLPVYATSLPGGAPRLRKVGDAGIIEGQSYSQKKPLMVQGTPPITWSLVSGPQGMTVNPQSGTVTWPWPLYRLTPYRIRLSAKNSLGADETSWTLAVAMQPAPRLSAPVFARGTQTTATWTSIPNISGYTIQRDDTSDFSKPLATITVSSMTLNQTFTGLVNGQISWFRVRGNTVGGLTGLWSNVTSCTQDAAAPAVTLVEDTRLGDWQPAVTARLIVGATDPGSRPSGLSQMRLSLDAKNWTAWMPVYPGVSTWLGRAGSAQVHLQVSDRVGNIKELAVTVNAAAPSALYVDDDNTGGPWEGTLAHPYRKIQEAIDAATNGKVVIVAPGQYKENIQFKGKNIVLRSADPQSPEIVKATVIDGQQKGHVVVFAGTEATSCTLAGFTITNGYVTGREDCRGGGILGNRAKAAVLNNRIVNNMVYYYNGYGSEWEGIIYNYHYGHGGGIAGCDGIIGNNIIANNRFAWNSAAGATVGKPQYPPPPQIYNIVQFEGAALYDCNGPIIQNTIWNNAGKDYDGSTLAQCQGPIRDNIIWNAKPVLLRQTSVPEYCCLNSTDTPAGEGNITVNPLLVDPAGGDFHLRADSPCIDAGGFNRVLRDMDGEARGIKGVAESRGDGTLFDIGADEFAPPEQALWIMAPEGGGTVAGNASLTVHWHADPARAGSTVNLFLYYGNTLVANLGPSTNALGDGTCAVRLPNVGGADYCIRAVSVKNPALFAQSAPFVMRAANAVAPGEWMSYR